MSDMLVRNRYFDDLFATPDLAWMGQNTNHIPAHPAVIEAITASVAALEFNAYAPPLGFESLRKAIIADFGVDGVEAIVTEGGVNALAMVTRAHCRPGTTFVTTDPTWKWPCQFAEQMGAEVIRIPIYDPACNYRLTPEALAAHVDERTAIIYLVDPNNPLGITYPGEEIEAFAEIARSCGALLVHDCTYRDFASDHTPAITVAPDVSIVSMSFSKWLGLAGLRVGALVARQELLEAVAPYASGVLGSSVIAQRAAEAGLRVKRDWMASVLAIDAANKAMIRGAFAKLPGFSLPVWPSQGNFLVIETTESGLRPEALVAAFSREGVMIRQGSYHTETFGDRFIKVSTTVPKAWAEKFCAVLPKAIETARTINDVQSQF
ncbi:Histidinol-phosphate aminotransferase [Hartmannibacter diazotrophicus]|uniref:Aminotransferase n=1 Tax=Hartmannibacter diazotrophicus TaxID=1482074 RepID=A0A2C9D9F4_9HYPH|nr:pyridoxal phosphate-dependent aminotransferase [Hartmannibacter diazotrophicus]SON56800.1 Histidinol-phosphate aminotransferase [Hartmannibacter diazotrophicus]